MATSIPHRSVAAAILAVWGAVALLALPIALRTSAGPWALAGVLAAGAMIGGITSGAITRLGPATAAVAAAVAVLLIGGMKDDTMSATVAVTVAIAAGAAAIGALAGRRMQAPAVLRPILVGLIIMGVLTVLAGIVRRLERAGWIVDGMAIVVFAALGLGGAIAAGLVREARARDAAFGAAGAMTIVVGVVGLATASSAAWAGLAVMVPIAAGLAGTGFFITARVLAATARRGPELPTARTVDRD